MAITIRHFGLVVRNIDKSLVFYSELLGLPVLSRCFEKGSFIDNVVGIAQVNLEWAKLQDIHGVILELLQYHSHPDNIPFKNYPSNRHGASHVAFTVSNLDELYKKLITLRFSCNSEPQKAPDGNVKVLYCHDPDGVLVELVEKLAI